MLDARLIQMAVAEFGTPLYVYDWLLIERQVSRLRKAFPAFELLYAVKANPWPPLLRRLATLADGMDVSSQSELTAALEAGVAPAAISYTGPGKTEADLCAIIAAGVTLDVDSPNELKRANSISTNIGRRTRVTLRVNTVSRPAEAGEYMAGGATPFGIDEETLAAVWSQADTAALDLAGLHAHVASQVLDVGAIARHFEHLVGVSSRFHHATGAAINVINFGGGFGIPYCDSDSDLDLERLSATASVMLRAAEGAQLLHRYQLELGRYIVGPAGSYITKVVDVKVSRGKHFVVCDSGISGFSRPAMPWAQRHRCRVVGAVEGQESFSSIVGRTCLPADVISSEAWLPPLAAGDLIEVENAGAYGFSMSLVRWGSLSEPGQVFCDGLTVTSDGTQVTAGPGLMTK